MSSAITAYRRTPKVLNRAARVAPDDEASMSSLQFRVELEAFRGPLDLLLYLVRKHEVEVVDLPIAPITDQFLAYLEVLEKLDVDRLGEFIEMAGHLIEIKSRLVLPHADEVEAPLEDPRQDLVEQLLEYKRFRDAASMLEDRFRTWQDHFGRLASEVPSSHDEMADEPIREVELWDLVSAFTRIMRDFNGGPQASIKVDEVPIHVHMERIADLLNRDGRVALGDLYEEGMPKQRLVGLFLAVLELMRHHGVKTEQDNLFGEIIVKPPAAGKVTMDLCEAVDAYEHGLAPPAAPKAAPAQAASAAAEGEARIDAPQAAVPAPHEETAKKKTRSRRAK